MKVLLLSLYHPEIVRGGAQQLCYELFRGLQSRSDVEVSLLAAVDPAFTSLYKAGAQITGFDGRPHEYVFLSRDYDYQWHKVSNADLVASFSDFLKMLRPDVIHFHHFLLFGIDMVSLARRVVPGARIVFTFHEFLSICDASGQMVRKTDRSLCTRASATRCHQCLPDRPPETFFTRELWFKRHLSSADVFTVPSKFMIERYASWGLPRGKLLHVTNGQPDYSDGKHSVEARKKRNRIGFFGQLVDNKGVWLLLQAVEMLRARGFTDFTVEINGDNIQFASAERRQEIERFLKEESERPIAERNVVFNGSYSVDQLASRMQRIDWCVVPSVWWEIFGLVISEAWMFKRPVIASNVGGPAERITHEKDGLLFNLADPAALAEAIHRACTEEGLWKKLSTGIKRPTSEKTMVEEYLAVYQRRRSRTTA